MDPERLAAYKVTFTPPMDPEQKRFGERWWSYHGVTPEGTPFLGNPHQTEEEARAAAREWIEWRERRFTVSGADLLGEARR